MCFVHPQHACVVMVTVLHIELQELNRNYTMREKVNMLITDDLYLDWHLPTQLIVEAYRI